MIVIAYGRDFLKTAYDALAASDIGKYLKPEFKVSLKPNLVVPGPASNGAVTHTEVTEGVIQFLKDFGVSRIKIIESSWIGENTINAFRDCGYSALAKKYGIDLIDLKKDNCTTLEYDGLRISICNEALDTDFLINLPVLKAHCQTLMTCCMKNLKGCIPDSEKRRFHTLGIHKPVAVLNALIKTGYCVVDGICGDLTFEEGGTPVTAERIIAGRNPLSVDSYCAALIGYNPDDIGYLTYGKKLGIGSYHIPGEKITEIGAENKPLCNSSETKYPGKINAYRSLIDEQSACSACYCALIHALHRTVGNPMQRRNTTGSRNGKIHIGQGFKGITGAGIGIGKCTSGFEINVKGCPPAASEIMDLLNNL